MKYLVSKDKLIIDIAKQSEHYKRRIAISVVRQNTESGLIATFELKPLASVEDIEKYNLEGQNIPLESLVLLGGGKQEIPVMIRLTKAFDNDTVDALYDSITFPADVITRTQRDKYFELVSASKIIEQDGLFGGLTESDFEILEIS